MYGVCLTTFEPTKVEITNKSEVRIAEIFQPKCICILSAYPYLLAFREYLTQLERLSKSGEMTVPLERYISNFCSEVPAPPSGSFEVQTTISNSVIKLWSPPYNQPIAWVSLPFSHLFECLDIDNVITLWHAIALERQVLLVSSQKSLLTIICEILLSLLFPMKWAYAYIPLVPKFSVSILAAPMPFLCGIEKDYLNVAVQHLNDECIVVDLDSNLISFGPATPELAPIPRDVHKTLKETLRENVGMIYRETRSLTKDHDFSERGVHLPTDIKTTADAMWESRLSLYDESFHLSFIPSQGENHLNGYFSEHKNDSKQTRWDAVQEVFMNVYVGLLSSYRQCLVFPSKDNQQLKDSGSFDSFGGAGFKTKHFLKAQRHDRRDFLKELIHTQMFDEFITKRLYGSGASDVTFFDLAIDNYLQVSEFSMNNSNAFFEAQERGGHPPRPSSAPTRSMRNLLNKMRSDLSIEGKSKPILYSSVVRKQLKTIVAPEPSTDNIPINSFMVNASINSLKKVVDDETAETDVITPLSSFENPDENEENDVHFVGETYQYSSFPSRLNENLFGNSRPIPGAILAEFERQNQDAAMFRKKGRHRLEMVS